MLVAAWYGPLEPNRVLVKVEKAVGMAPKCENAACGIKNSEI